MYYDLYIQWWKKLELKNSSTSQKNSNKQLNGNNIPDFNKFLNSHIGMFTP